MRFYWHPLLVLWLIAMVTLLTQSASVPTNLQQAAAGPKSPPTCMIERRKIMDAAQRYYKARYDTKLLLLKLRIHRQRHVEKQLRDRNRLLQLNLRHQVSRRGARRAKRQNIAAQLNDKQVFLPLTTRKSIKSKVTSLRRVHSNCRRQKYRILTFRYRIYRIRRNRRILVSRISKLRIKYNAQKQLILSTEAKLRGLTQQFHLLSKNARASKTAFNRLSLEIKQITAKIQNLKRKTAALKQRILRALARQRRMGHRIAILQQRLQKQIRAGNALTLDFFKVLSRLKIIIVTANSRVNKAATHATHAKSNDGVDGTKPVPIYVPKSKADVQRIISIFKAIQAKLLNQYVQVLTSRERTMKYKSSIQGLEDHLTKLSQKIHMTGKAGFHLRQTIFQTKKRLTQLRSIKRDEEKRLAHYREIVKLTMLDFIKYLDKYGVTYDDGSRRSSRWVARDQRRIIRRERRRKILQAQHKALIRRVSSAADISSRTARRLVKQQASRIYRAERRRIAKRVVKRVKRIEKKIKHAIHKAKIVHQRKLHIQRRQHRLERRAHRIMSREGRIKQTIENAEIKHMRLVRKLNQLKLNKEKLKSQGKSVNMVHRIDTQIKQAFKNVTDHWSRTNKLKKRRIHILSRLHKINIKKQRLRDRLTAIQQRSKRNEKKIEKLDSKEKKFVRRVVKKRLISRRVIQRVVTLDPRIFRNQKTRFSHQSEKPGNSANGWIESSETQEVIDPEKPGNAKDSANGWIESSVTQEVKEPGEEKIVYE